MKKKSIAIILTVALVATLTTGCGGSNNPVSKDETGIDIAVSQEASSSTEEPQSASGSNLSTNLARANTLQSAINSPLSIWYYVANPGDGKDGKVLAAYEFKDGEIVSFALVGGAYTLGDLAQMTDDEILVVLGLNKKEAALESLRSKPNQTREEYKEAVRSIYAEFEERYGYALFSPESDYLDIIADYLSERSDYARSCTAELALVTDATGNNVQEEALQIELQCASGWLGEYVLLFGSDSRPSDDAFTTDQVLRRIENGEYDDHYGADSSAYDIATDEERAAWRGFKGYNSSFVTDYDIADYYYIEKGSVDYFDKYEEEYYSWTDEDFESYHLSKEEMDAYISIDPLKCIGLWEASYSNDGHYHISESGDTITFYDCDIKIVSTAWNKERIIEFQHFHYGIPLLLENGEIQYNEWGEAQYDESVDPRDEYRIILRNEEVVYESEDKYEAEELYDSMIDDYNTEYNGYNADYIYKLYQPTALLHPISTTLLCLKGLAPLSDNGNNIQVYDSFYGGYRVGDSDVRTGAFYGNYFPTDDPAAFITRVNEGAGIFEYDELSSGALIDPDWATS